MLKAFRVMAYVVGVMLLALLVAALVKRIPGVSPTVVTVATLVQMLHGFLYAIYLFVAIRLGMQAKWNWWYTLAVLIAGTIPFLSFVAERKVTHRMAAAG